MTLGAGKPDARAAGSDRVEGGEEEDEAVERDLDNGDGEDEGERLEERDAARLGVDAELGDVEVDGVAGEEEDADVEVFVDPDDEAEPQRCEQESHAEVVYEEQEE